MLVTHEAGPEKSCPEDHNSTWGWTV